MFQFALKLCKLYFWMRTLRVFLFFNKIIDIGQRNTTRSWGLFAPTLGVNDTLRLRLTPHTPLKSILSTEIIQEKWRSKVIMLCGDCSDCQYWSHNALQQRKATWLPMFYVRPDCKIEILTWKSYFKMACNQLRRHWYILDYFYSTFQMC